MALSTATIEVRWQGDGEVSQRDAKLWTLTLKQGWHKAKRGSSYVAPFINEAQCDTNPHGFVPNGDARNAGT
jgi:hypothetical protein